MIPLILRSSFLAFTDTVKISPDQVANQLKEGLLIANVVNGFPLDMELELRVPDSVTNEILETVQFSAISSAIVGSSGRVTEPTTSQATGTFDENFMQSLERANKAYIYTKSNTFNNGEIPVGLYSDYLLEVAIGFKVVVNP
jgi:hypothetical protein